MVELHGESVVVRENWTQRLQPLNAKYKVDSTQGQNMEIDWEGLALNMYWNILAKLVTLKFITVADSDS